MTLAKSLQGKSNRLKGAAHERTALRLLQSIVGVSRARRTPSSGGLEGYEGDIEVDLLGGLDVEIKYSSADTGMRTMRRYLEPVAMVMARGPKLGWMYIMKADLAERLLTDSVLLAHLRKLSPVSVGVAEDSLKRKLQEPTK